MALKVIQYRSRITCVLCTVYFAMRSLNLSHTCFWVMTIATRHRRSSFYYNSNYYHFYRSDRYCCCLFVDDGARKRKPIMPINRLVQIGSRKGNDNDDNKGHVLRTLGTFRTLSNYFGLFLNDQIIFRDPIPR